jgi:hypothetical protein
VTGGETGVTGAGESAVKFPCPHPARDIATSNAPQAAKKLCSLAERNRLGTGRKLATTYLETLLKPT